MWYTEEYSSVFPTLSWVRIAMEDPRLIRRILVVSGFLVFFGLIGWLIYTTFLKSDPTCFDGKQNQNETGIDCGGSCTKQCVVKVEAKDLVTKETAFMPVGDGSYDVLAQVYNPNDVAGASSFTYTVSLRDASGQILSKQSGTSFILPQETKYLFEFHLASASVPAQAVVEFSGIVWEHFDGYAEKPRISVVHQSYARVTSGSGYGAATGLVINESPYDFRSLTVKVVLRDALGKPVAINMTAMQTMKSKEQRDFRLVWPTAFPGEVAAYEMLVDADVYHTDNFIKQSGSVTPF